MLSAIPWKRGPAAPDGEVVVAVTDFRVHRWRHVPGVWWNGLRLRHFWPGVEGAVAIRQWSDRGRPRSGSVSVWASEEALRRFLRTRAHRAVASRYRDLADLGTHKFRAERFDPHAIWAEAERRLSDAPPRAAA